MTHSKGHHTSDRVNCITEQAINHNKTARTTIVMCILNVNYTRNLMTFK
jgi:hypothetical protein